MTGTDAPAPRTRKRPKDRREQILREAYRLIAEAGFNAVSLADVAAASGIQKSSVLHHFRSMNELLLGVLALREELDFGFYAEGAEHGPAANAAEARARFTRVFEHNLSRPEFMRIYAILSGESLAKGHPAHRYFAERALFARAEIARSLAWKPDPALAAAELLAFWEGLELSLGHDPKLDARAVWESFADRFFR